MGKTLGFIGCGNMAKAMIRGMIASGVVQPQDITASEPNELLRQEAVKELGIIVTEDNKKAAQSDFVVLSVKPQVYPAVILEIAPSLSEQTVVVTIAPGQSLERLEHLFGKKVKLVRTMPNTPALVAEGMTALVAGDAVSSEEKEQVCALFSTFGKVEEVKESWMDAVVGVSGSSPAYVYLLIEAMADAAVLEGMPRKQATVFAAQAVYGSAKMVLESGQHPGALKDMVCSPAGTTIVAVRSLEENGFRSAAMEAVIAAAKAAKKL